MLCKKVDMFQYISSFLYFFITKWSMENIKITKYIKFLKFFFFWLLTYSINIGLTFLLKENLWLNLYVSYLISLFVVTIINFTSSLKIIFKEKYSHTILIRYLSVLWITTFLNYIIVNILDYFLWNTYIIIFIVTTIFFFLKFIVYDKFVFSKK